MLVLICMIEGHRINRINKNAYYVKTGKKKGGGATQWGKTIFSRPYVADALHLSISASSKGLDKLTSPSDKAYLRLKPLHHNQQRPHHYPLQEELGTWPSSSFLSLLKEMDSTQQEKKSCGMMGRKRYNWHSLSLLLHYRAFLYLSTTNFSVSLSITFCLLWYWFLIGPSCIFLLHKQGNGSWRCRL